MMKYIPPKDHPKGTGKSSEKVATFYDLDKDAWRSVSKRSREVVLKKDKGKPTVVVRDKDKEKIVPIAKKLREHGLELLATEGTCNYLNKNGIEIEKINKVSKGSQHIVDKIRDGEVELIINTPTTGKQPKRDGYKIRRAAVDLKIPYITNIQAAKAATNAIEAIKEGSITTKSINEYQDQIERKKHE